MKPKKTADIRPGDYVRNRHSGRFGLVVAVPRSSGGDPHYIRVAVVKPPLSEVHVNWALRSVELVEGVGR